MLITSEFFVKITVENWKEIIKLFILNSYTSIVWNQLFLMQNLGIISSDEAQRLENVSGLGFETTAYES